MVSIIPTYWSSPTTTWKKNERVSMSGKPSSTKTTQWCNVHSRYGGIGLWTPAYSANFNPSDNFLYPYLRKWLSEKWLEDLRGDYYEEKSFFLSKTWVCLENYGILDQSSYLCFKIWYKNYYSFENVIENLLKLIFAEYNFYHFFYPNNILDVLQWIVWIIAGEDV